jgi:hypothetical protein
MGRVLVRIAWLLIAAALAGCAGPPLVDMTDVDPVVYQRDFDHCEVAAPSHEWTGAIIVGALMGATIGLGAATFAATEPGFTLATGYGAAAGAAEGAGASAVTGTPLAVPPPAGQAAAPPAVSPPGPQQSLADCLAAHGYKVITPAR